MSMTECYKYSLKEHGILSKPIKKKYLKGTKKGSNINDQKAKLVSNPFFVLWFSPDCGLFTCLRITRSQALAHSKCRAAYL